MRTALSDFQAAGVSLFGQGARLLTLRFPESARIREDAVLPHRLTGEEALSTNYRYTLECLSADTHLELKSFLGQPLELSLLLPDGGARLLTGLVTRAEQNGADGGFATYTLTIEPALATLAHRRNSRVFQDQSVPQIVSTLLGEHLARNPAFTGCFSHIERLHKTYPNRSYCLQYRESDLAFIERLLAEEGISYRYTHGPDPDTSLRPADGHETRPAQDTPQEQSDIPQHHLILFDANDTLPPSRPGDARTNVLRYHRTDGIEADDALDHWHASRQLQSGHTQLTSYDYKAVSTHTGSDPTRTDHGPRGRRLSDGLEDYDPQTLYYGSDPDDLERYAALRQQAKDLAGKRFSGQGTARHLVPGTWFELQDHPIHDQNNQEDRQFLVTRLRFEAENNLTLDAKQSLGGLLAKASNATRPITGTTTADSTDQNRPPYRNTLETVRRHIPIVPDYTRTPDAPLQDGSTSPSGRTAHQKPTAGGLTTATVVGPADEEIFTDEHGRIKIQFHWQRQQDHPQGGADLDDHSSTWVRVALPSAGAAWGTQYIPRIGQEVIIDFLEGDIDRPLVTGVVYNGTHRSPTFSGAGQLPANKTLSGHKSKEYKGSRYNELLFDDSTNEIRTKLSSEHGKTQLNQGFLIHPRTDGKGEPRGEGFELRTDHHGAIRAAQGLFLTTEAQTGATGKQIARAHAQTQADAALSLAKRLGEVATKQAADTLEHGPETISPDNAKESKTTKGHLQHHIDALKAWDAGTNTDKDKTAKDEPGRQPIMVLSAPAGITALTGQNLSLGAGTNLDFIAQRDINQTSGRRWLHNVGQHLSLFVNGVKGAISAKLIAAQGKVQVQAQHGDIEITAEQAITVTACKGKVTMAAKEEILLTSGGGYIRIKDGNIEIHCPELASFKAASHPWSGPDRMTVAHPAFPTNLPKMPVMITTDHSPEGQKGGWAGMPYKLYADGAKISEGVLDDKGALNIDHEVTTREYTMELANGMSYDIPVPTDYSNAAQGNPANRGFLRHRPGKAPDAGATTQRANVREDYVKLLKGVDSEGDAS